jgi:ribosomal protein RSM22 (predicted rRNA methylase)
MIDTGAGPGTAVWAATGAFPTLSDIVLLDANPTLMDLARTLTAGHEPLAEAGFRVGPAHQLLANAPGADLVIASYVIGELAERERDELASMLWERTRDTLLVVEPGTPAGYGRIIALRARLIAEGAHVIAPCPHNQACPLVAPDWCHFAQRLPRTRDHMLLKNADVPFEDEKFSYVTLSRVPSASRAARVLAPPHIGKAAVEAKLCTASGVNIAQVPRREKAAYAKARRWRWGDGAGEIYRR